MKLNKWMLSVGVAGLLGVVPASHYLRAQQGPNFGPPDGNFGPDDGPPNGPNGFPGGPGPNGFPDDNETDTAATTPLPPSKFSITEREGFRYITSNGIPNHATGKFPHPGNPGRISAQDWKFRVPLHPTVTTATPGRHGIFGIAVNGIPYDPATNEFWNFNRAWNYDALSGKVYLGTDFNNAHVQPGGIYHYHGLPSGLIEKVAKKNQMTLIGYGADGFPMYATSGHATANDAKSPLKVLRSSYRLKEGTRPGGNVGPGGEYDGTFIADWEYVKGAGDLDECNGRTGVTPEYPQGTYYYVVTAEFPFVPRMFRGTPDPSFNHKGGPPPGGMGDGRGAMSNRQGGPENGRGGSNGGGPPRLDGPSLDEMTRVLNLTPAQQVKIKALLDSTQQQIEAALTPAQQAMLRRQQNGDGPQGNGGPPNDGGPPNGGNNANRERMIEGAAKDLGVSTEKFRAAFLKVHPDNSRQRPTREQHEEFARSLGVSPEQLEAVMQKWNRPPDEQQR